MRKILLSLMVGATITGASALSLPQEVTYFTVNDVYGRQLGAVSVVKEGIKVSIVNQVKVITWEDIELLKKTAAELPQ